MPRWLTLTVLLIILVPQISAEGLRAGAAQSVITPGLLREHVVYLAGFGHNRAATGVHDDLYARCLALGIATQTLVLCSADLIGLFYDDVLSMRRAFHEKAPAASFLVVASTHTHAGPDTLGLYGPKPLQTGIDGKYLDWVDQRIASTAADAVRAMQPALLELGRDDHPLLESLQGVDRPPRVKDPFLFVLRLVAPSSRRTIATMVNWSDHPEVLGRKNSLITSDYPHWVRNYMEMQFGGTALFFPGSIGKVSPLGEQVSLLDPETGKIAEDGAWRKAELLGTEIGRLAERALKSATRINPDSLSIRTEIVFVPMHNRQFRAAAAAGVFAGRKLFYTDGKLDPAKEERDLPGVGRVEYATGHDIQTEVDYIQLRAGGTALAEILTIPGEIYPELVNGGVARYVGADYPEALFEPVLREQLQTRYQFILGLGNDEIGYLIPKAEWDEEPPWLANAPQPWYGEVNSVGPEAAGAVLRALVALVRP
ncbi:MAG TPA: hypothetical protein VEK33_21410 [Terriglobales bacterium]|nr:hypothetical protein [Terriglobales bacterium]